MTQICTFDSEPSVVNKGGIKKGRPVVWLNLQITPTTPSEYDNSAQWQSVSQRIPLPELSISALLDAADPSHIMLASNAETQSIMASFSAQDDVESWRRLRTMQVRGYDQSPAVNSFTIGDTAMWFDKATRVGLVNSITIERNAGREKTVLWNGNERIEMGVDAALSLMSELELYAVECYNVTSRHLAAIQAAETVAYLSEFDITADYPAPLRFSPT